MVSTTSITMIQPVKKTHFLRKDKVPNNIQGKAATIVKNKKIKYGIEINSLIMNQCRNHPK